jgi:hypothetical protein
MKALAAASALTLIGFALHTSWFQGQHYASPRPSSDILRPTTAGVISDAELSASNVLHVHLADGRVVDVAEAHRVIELGDGYRNGNLLLSGSGFC